MKQYRFYFIKVWIQAFGLLAWVCVNFAHGSSSNLANHKPLILVSVPPLAYFVRFIGGDSVEVKSVVSAEVSPETYEPKPSQAYAFMRAKAFIGVGMGYEQAIIARLQDSTPSSKTPIFINLTESILHTNTSANPSTKLSASTKTSTHTPHANHNHDPHIWLSLTFAKPIAQTICATLSAINPSQKPLYESNLRTLLSKLDTMRSTFSKQLAHKKGDAFVVIHPAFGYLAREFELEEIALEQDGKEITLKTLSNLHTLLQQRHIHTLFIQPQFDKDRALSIAQTLSLKTAMLDPLREDWEANLYDFLEKIAHDTGGAK